MDGGKVLSMKFPLIIKKIPVALNVIHNRVTHFTRVSLAKFVSIVKSKKLMDRSLWPISLIFELGGMVIKIQVAFSPKQKKFLVKVNNIKYYSLPYRASTWNPQKPRADLNAVIIVNDEFIMDGTSPWFPYAM